jgi:uncharacterized membrane protein (UPF0182 family)
MPRTSRVLIFIVALLFFFGGPSLVGFATDWLWFGELGYQQVFLTILRAQGTLFTITFAIAVTWLIANLRYALGSVGDTRPVFTTRDGIELALPGRQQLRAIANLAALVLGGLIALFASSQWETWLAWRFGVPFGQADPILGRDVGFYVFALPFFQFVKGLGQSLVVLAAIACGAIYFVSGSFSSRFGTTTWVTPAARRHLSFLAAVFLLLLAFGAWLGQAEKLILPSGVIYGPGYADVNGRMPAALVLVAVSIVGAALAVVQATSRRNWPLPVAVALYLVVAVGGEVYSTMLQRFVVTPNEQTRETPFIQHNIDATRRAFALDRVEARELSATRC